MTPARGPSLTSLAQKALTLADEAARSELAVGLTMPSSVAN